MNEKHDIVLGCLCSIALFEVLVIVWLALYPYPPLDEYALWGIGIAGIVSQIV